MREEEARFRPIGAVHTCFQEKFGIPRQSGLVPGAHGVIKLASEPFLKNAIRTLEGFSHIWVIFVFHRHEARGWKPSVRPPRLGGARKVGVLASRSPHRPNPIGLSVVKLLGVDPDAPGGPEIRVGGVDMLDGTPVLDIKPYLPYADSIPDAKAGWAEEPIERVPVEFTAEALASIASLESRYRGLRELITQMLEIDPRPAFQKRKLPVRDPGAQGTHYGFRLSGLDVRWELREERFLVFEIAEIPQAADDDEAARALSPGSRSR